ncbi:response regulator transcription factor [Actinotalea sp. K2]|uniref:response regulator n=1 Tax=Actinotalea sp. K2 TaxID=2939438 RepID=UPI002017E9C6|nr:response regulator transcription factor [Actinotalea sp. K2]MCL3859677.1 response regulator transcription factor [Actinotalea sp. K2]
MTQDDEPTPVPLRVVVVDDEALVRRGLTVLLRLEPGLDVVGEASDGAGALSVVRRERPDVVLMDIRMPGTDGLAATRAIMADPATADTRVIILTTFDLDEHVFAAVRAGASGFLPKDTAPVELLTAIRVVARGDALLAPAVTRRLIEEFVRRSPVAPASGAPGLELLTEREVEVLRAVAEGLSNVEIAERLFVTYATVKTHVSRLLTKLHARDRAQLVMLAYEGGVVRPGV